MQTDTIAIHVNNQIGNHQLFQEHTILIFLLQEQTISFQLLILVKHHSIKAKTWLLSFQLDYRQDK